MPLTNISTSIHAISKRLFALKAFISYKMFGEVPLPATLMIETGNLCNLKCPLCPTGVGIMDYPKGFMTLATYRTILDRVKTAKSILLYNWGEPLLNPNIIDFIVLAKERGIQIRLDTNFSMKLDDTFINDLAKSNLDYLYVAIDGASQETYSKLRSGGNLETVLLNISRLVDAKRSLNSTRPEIVWKFIVTRFNEADIETASKLASDYGISFEIDKLGLSDDLPDISIQDSIEHSMKYWLPQNREYVRDCYLGQYSYPIFSGRCEQLFSLLVIGWNGNVFPCCWVSSNESVFGNIINNSIYEVWNNKKFSAARSLFVSKNKSTDIVDIVCHNCNNFDKYSR